MNIFLYAGKQFMDLHANDVFYVFLLLLCLATLWMKQLIEKITGRLFGGLSAAFLYLWIHVFVRLLTSVTVMMWVHVLKGVYLYM